MKVERNTGNFLQWPLAQCNGPKAVSAALLPCHCQELALHDAHQKLGTGSDPWLLLIQATTLSEEGSPFPAPHRSIQASLQSCPTTRNGACSIGFAASAHQELLYWDRMGTRSVLCFPWVHHLRLSCHTATPGKGEGEKVHRFTAESVAVRSRAGARQ